MIRTDWVPTPWRDAARRRILLELVCFRPEGAGPFPTVIFNHGSTGIGRDPARFRVTWVAEELGQWLGRRGWQVFFPQRRGRGRSGGSYEEGLEADGSGYSQAMGLAAAGLRRALSDLDVVASHVFGHMDVDRRQVLLGGVSRGGLLSLAYAAEHPFSFRGVINFAGGWLGEGARDADVVNATLFVRSAAFPGDTLWIYARGDTYYRESFCQDNFRRFVAAGGRGHLHLLPAPPQGPAHHVHEHPPAWEALLDSYLASLATTPAPCS